MVLGSPQRPGSHKSSNLRDFTRLPPPQVSSSLKSVHTHPTHPTFFQEQPAHLAGTGTINLYNEKGPTALYGNSTGFCCQIHLAWQVPKRLQGGLAVQPITEITGHRRRTGKDGAAAWLRGFDASVGCSPGNAQLAEAPKSPLASFKMSAPEHIWKHFSDSSLSQKRGRDSTWRGVCVGKRVSGGKRTDHPSSHCGIVICPLALG